MNTTGFRIRNWLIDLQHQHDVRLINRGRAYVSRICNWQLATDGESVECEVTGSAAFPYRVTLRLPGELFAAIQPRRRLGELHGELACTCPHSESGAFLCKHTSAAVARLLEMSDARPTVGLEQLICESRPGSAVVERLAAYVAKQRRGGERSRARLGWVVREHRGGPFGGGLSLRPYAIEGEDADNTAWHPLRWAELSESDRFELLPQDRAAIGTLSSHTGEGGFGARGNRLYAAESFDLASVLVGHPRVVFDKIGDSKLQLSCGELGLVCRSVDGGFSLQPTVCGQVETTWQFFAAPLGLLGLEATHNSLIVLRTDADIRDLVLALRDDHIVTIQESAGLRLQLQQLSGQIPVFDFATSVEEGSISRLPTFRQRCSQGARQGEFLRIAR